MNKKYKIGIDIGGTHTDGVIVDESTNIIAFAKCLTTDPVDIGFARVICDLLKTAKLSPEMIEDVCLGTTHATNAILQRMGLYRVGVIRIAGHHPESIPSCYSWPNDLKEVIYAGTVSVGGGYECDGTPISSFDSNEVKRALECLVRQGAESLAVIGVFSPLNAIQEREVKSIAHDILGKDFPVSLSHQIGGIGFIERENSTLLNASLKRFMKNGFSRLQHTLAENKLTCPLWITQNNGSRMHLEHASEYPVLTISAGPTNSFIGGAKLAGWNDAIVVDVGGTSTDVGVVRSGYPRRRLNKSKMGGIALNFSMPDVLSIALGGGSHVDSEGIKIGPLSCGKDTFTQGISFGGNCLTLTDVALALGTVDIHGAQPSRIKISRNTCQDVVNKARDDIQELVHSIGIDEQYLPVVMIGGGASLFKYQDWNERFRSPGHSNVANAYGAALAEFSATIDTVLTLTERDKMIADLEEQVMALAIAQGADPSKVRIVDKHIIPYHYASQPIARVVITSSG